jgi:hypothetical protein
MRRVGSSYIRGEVRSVSSQQEGKESVSAC